MPTINSFTRLNIMNKLILVFLLIGFISCSKDKRQTITIEGYVLDENTNIAISGAEVVVVKESCCGGCNWEFIDSLSSDVNGYYRIDIAWRDYRPMYTDSYVSPNYKIVVRKGGRIEGKDGFKQIDNSEDYQRIDFDLPIPKYTKLRIHNDSLIDFYKKLKIVYRYDPNTSGIDFCGFLNSDTTVYYLNNSYDTTFVVESGSINYGLGGDNSQWDKWSTKKLICNNADTCSSLISY
jgi:hypothetical protein